MQKRKISKVLVLTTLLSSLFVPHSNYVMAASADPDVTIIRSTDLPTNQDIIITIETNDDLSGIKEIVLPDGTKVTEESTTYTITENGDYEFKVFDNAGNETKGTVVIDNIDRTKPILELVPSTTTPTNKDIVIAVKASDTSSGIKEIVLPDGTKVAEEKTSYTVSENGSYTFKAIDNAGNEVEETIIISNIDKVLPTITIEPYNTSPTNQDITVHAKVDKGTLNQDSYTFTENGSFTFVVTDEAGNRAEKEIVITNIDKENPTLELVPDKTEPTNQDVIITVISTDTSSGIKEIVLPDGTKVTEESTTYTVNENGSYTFKAIDNAGNETEKTIEIANIDRILPTITIEPYSTEWTNKDIIVYAKVDKGTLNQDSYTFTENGSFTFVVTDEAGNRAEKEVVINNIDKTKPTMKIIIGE